MGSAGWLAGAILVAGICSGQTAPDEILREKGKVTAVTFISARCPISNAYGDRLEAIYQDYAGRGMRFLVFYSNSNESMEEIRDNARAHRFTFEVRPDPKSAAAILLGAIATPESFVLDADGKVRYHGALDDAQNPARVKHRYVRDALDAVLKGQAPAVTESKFLGCSIKRPRR